MVNFSWTLSPERANCSRNSSREMANFSRIEVFSRHGIAQSWLTVRVLCNWNRFSVCYLFNYSLVCLTLRGDWNFVVAMTWQACCTTPQLKQWRTDTRLICANCGNLFSLWKRRSTTWNLQDNVWSTCKRWLSPRQHFHIASFNSTTRGQCECLVTKLEVAVQACALFHSVTRSPRWISYVEV